MTETFIYIGVIIIGMNLAVLGFFAGYSRCDKDYKKIEREV